jgi:gamma-glutamyltranspeptidase/glutathione hydrolase
MNAAAPETAHRPTIAVTRHAIAAGHYLAATAGFDILQAGGNAIDAGVAAGIALGVVQSDLVNCAGVAPILIYHAEKREVVTIAGLGPWPKALDPELFMREHGGKIPVGVLRTVVPAAPDAWITALRRYGTMSFGDVAAAATRLAREGFPMYPLMSASLKKHAERHASWPSSPAKCSARAISAPLCNTWPTRRRPPNHAAATPGSKPPATPSTAATSRGK